MKIHSRVLSQHPVTGQSALLVRLAGDLPRLEGIYLKELKLVLFLDPDGLQYLSGNPNRIERVPIS